VIEKYENPRPGYEPNTSRISVSLLGQKLAKPNGAAMGKFRQYGGTLSVADGSGNSQADYTPAGPGVPPSATLYKFILTSRSWRSGLFVTTCTHRWAHIYIYTVELGYNVIKGT
jgi:hypothetical protein